MTHNLFRTALILGLVSAIGPFAIDMYLPALPSIGRSLAASPDAVQMSLTVFFVVIGLCQIVYGPVADMVGRKPPLYFGVGLFGFASIGCALAPNIQVLIACRAVQAVGACAGMVVPRAIVRDLHTGAEATRLMSLLMLVFSISPILAPLVGSLIIAAVGWRGVFWVVALAAALGIGLMATQLRETRPRSARTESSWRSAGAGYRRLLGDPGFMGLTFTGAFGISAFFVYLANSSFVLINHFGLTPTAYALFFALNAVSFFAAAQFNGRLTARFGLMPVVRMGVIGFAAATLLLLALTSLGVDRLGVLAAFLFVGYGFLGLVVPTTAVLAMEEHGAIAGTASALLGALQMITGAVVMTVSGLFADGTPRPMVAGIATCAVIALGLSRLRPGAVPISDTEAAR